MHDLSLGPPVLCSEEEQHPNKTHSGPCYDGVYGCHLCHNAANDGQGIIGECEWCHTPNVFTRITKAWDEPVMYAICVPCVQKQNAELAQMALEYEEYERQNGLDDYWYDDPDCDDPDCDKCNRP